MWSQMALTISRTSAWVGQYVLGGGVQWSSLTLDSLLTSTPLDGSVGAEIPCLYVWVGFYVRTTGTRQVGRAWRTVRIGIRSDST